MTNLSCNNCGTTQKAKVFECCIPAKYLNRPEISKFFLLKVEKCSKCGQEKLQPVYLDNLGHYERLDFLKQKFFEKMEKSILKELSALPCIKRSKNGGFYLNYSEYGNIKRCFSNLSTLKMGLHLMGKDLDYAFVQASRL